MKTVGHCRKVTGFFQDKLEASEALKLRTLTGFL